MIALLTERENNKCLKCGSITEVRFRRRDRVPFLACIEEKTCKGTQDMTETKSSSGKKKNNGKNNFPENY